MKDLMQPAINYSDGKFIVCWSTKTAYAELTFNIATKKVDWFTKDRLTGSYDGSEDSIDYIPAQFLIFVTQHCAKEN